MKRLILLSGGLDSSALAALERPDGALFIDYGQAPAQGELTAARQVAAALALAISELKVDCSQIGSGLLAGAQSSVLAPSEEWWPFRNQLLVTLAAGWAIDRGYRQILLGTVCSDGERHSDGSAAFVDLLDELLSMQEGAIRVRAPAMRWTSSELIRRSPIARSALAWTHSCHSQALACGRCPGCIKRMQVLSDVDT